MRKTDLSPATRKRLEQAATQVMKNAHAPYSNFHVGAAILLTNGKIFSGCNVENASYGMTNCAERTAIFTAVAQLGPKIEIRAVAVANDHGVACSPCGACRQGHLRIRPRRHNLFPGGARAEGGAHYQTSPGRISPPVIQTTTAAQPFRAIDVIRKKRDGAELSRAEIEGLVNSYTKGETPDYQVSAWLMAVVLRGMTRPETAALTDAMLRSGEVLDLSALPARKVDKHSTGGVGDKHVSHTSPRWRGRGGRRRSDDQRTRSGAYGRHSRQAGIDPRLQCESAGLLNSDTCSRPAVAR